MLAKRYRLPSYLIPNFQGQKHPSRLLLVIGAPSPLSRDRLATIISKKVSAKATARNTLKRALHETLRPYVDTPPYFDYLIIARRSPDAVPQDYAADLLRLVTQLKTPQPTG